MSDTQNPSSPDIARRFVDFLASISEEEQVKVRTELLYTWGVSENSYHGSGTATDGGIRFSRPQRPRRGRDMSDMSPDMQDEARIAEELVLMEWQRDTDQIEILEENLQQALKDRQSDQSWIQDLESQLGQKNIKIEECGATLRNMDIEKVKQIKRLQED
ncbi:hypothetical protein B0H14DRAFT_3001241 [Mycena olivaceomarginata]|nr:hypothetical protein B0H14DRAFT_3001241 [Mycena olivaceomarginata]